MTTTLIEPPNTMGSSDRRRLPWDEIAVFAVVTLLASAVLLGLQRMFGASLGAAAGEAIQWVQFAPAVGVLAAVWRHRAAGRGRTGLAADVRIDRAASVRMVAALSVPVMLVAVWLLMPAFGSSAALAGPKTGGPAIIAVLVSFALGGVGEELGSRCWLQPILQKRMGLLGAAFRHRNRLGCLACADILGRTRLRVRVSGDLHRAVNVDGDAAGAVAQRPAVGGGDLPLLAELDVVDLDRSRSADRRSAMDLSRRLRGRRCDHRG